MRLVALPTLTVSVWPELATPYWTRYPSAFATAPQLTAMLFAPPVRVTTGLSSAASTVKVALVAAPRLPPASQ